MPWVKLTDDFYEDDKIITAGPVGLALWIVSVAWSARNLTDGRIPRAKVRGLLDWDGVAWHMWMGEIAGGGEDVEAMAVADELVRVGLWEADGPDFRIVNYLKYQPSAESVKAKRQSERERWFARRNTRETPSGVDEESDRSCDVPVPGSRTPTENETPLSASPKAKRATQLPDDFELDDGLRSFAADKCPGIDIDAETEQWRDHHRAKGDTAKDWRASWRTWMRNAKKWDRPPNGKRATALENSLANIRQELIRDAP